MKSKNLLLALALPVALTACTADDFMTDQSENPTVAGRKVVGNVTFVAPEGADTRTIWNDEDKKLDWTDTDVLGAALMDKLKENLTTEEGAAKYEIVNQLYSNYRYDYKNGEFTNNNATFVEGNYFVYAQFKAKQGREGLAYSIPAVQEVGEDGRGSWYENQMFLDHIFVKEGDSKVAVKPLPVFPLVTLNTTYEGDDANVVIKKIVISDANSGFGNVGTVKPAVTSVAEYNPLAGMGATFATESSKTENDYKVVQSSTLDKLFTAYKNAKKDFGKEYTVAAGKTEDNIVNPNLYEYFVAGNTKSASLTLEYTGSKQSEGGVMVVPLQKSTDHTATNLKIEIYTNKGLVTIAGNGSGDMSNQFTLSSAKEYNTKQNATSLKDKAENAIAFDSKKNADDKTTYAMPFLSDLTAGQVSRFYIKFKDDAILVPSEVTVTTTGELKDYLTNWYAGKKSKIIGGDNNTVIVNAAPEEGKKVEVDNDVLAFMANTAANPVLKFKGTITIPDGTSADALDKITKASEALAIINEASLTWKDNNKTFTTITNKGTLVVGEDADAVKTFNVTTINNLGTLTVKGSVSAVTNGNNDSSTATITLARGIVASLTNNAVATVSGNATVTELTNNKTLTVNAGATLETGASSINKGTITVAAGENGSYEQGGNWNVNGNFTNHAEVVNNVNVKANIVNGGKITVKDGIFTNGVSGIVIEKNATITNNGQIACADNGTEKGTFNNKGYMEVNAGTVTLITENEATAEILVNDGSAQINVPTTPGKITYIVNSQAALTDIPNSVNSLRVVASSIDLTGLDNKKDGKIEYLEFRSNQTMTIKCVENKSEFANVIFNGDNATTKVQFTVNGKLKATEKFEVKANARVTINDEIEFANATAANYTNQGTLLIIGKLNFSGIEAANKADVNLGEIYFSGGSAATNITWK